MFISRHRTFYSQAVLYFHFLVVVLLLQWFGQGTRRIQAKPSGRVIGGAPAPLGRFPYMCSVRGRGNRKHVCGGTLIKSQWVLTAAHCVDPTLEDSTGLSAIVYCGIYEREERNSSKMFAADRTYIHPQWNGNITKGYDIALIKLDAPSDAPLPVLATQGSFYALGNVFSALGWGFNSSGSFTDLLQIADRLAFVSTRNCNLERFWAGQILESMICAGTGEQDTQQGDSGGPLLQLDVLDNDYTLGKASRDLLVGITTFGGGSSESFKPGVYTSVGYFRDWTDCVIEEKDNCSSASLQPSPATEASSVPPETSAQSSSEAPEPLAESSEEATQRLEALWDLCPEVTQQRIVNETLTLEVARAAIKKDDFEIVAGLLCAGLNPDSEYALNNTEFTLRSSVYNWTLLGEAARYDSIMSARILINYGADLEKTSKRHRYRPLHLAARYNSPRVAKLLLDSGADIEGIGYYSGTPLFAAAEKDSIDVAKLLVRRGAVIDAAASFNRTPLHRAADFNAFRVAKFLIDSGANTTRVDTFGNTLLHTAAYEEAVPLIKVLVDNGADIDAKDNEGETPLHHAARYNRADVVKFLVENGALKSEKDEDGDTPLHEAARYGSLEVVKVLVDSGVDKNAKNNEGLTALHYAASRNRFDVAKFLVKNGASKKKRDDNGQTPYMEICEPTWVECGPEDRARLRRLLRV